MQIFLGKLSAREMPVSFLCKNCLGIMVGMNCTGARNHQLGPVVLLQMQFFVSVHASKAVSI